jgi:chemotaxis protein CheX
MTDQIFTPFSKATQEVFKLLLDLDALTDVSQQTNDAALGDTINIKIGLTGDFSGEIHYSFPTQTTLEMVKIMSGMEIDQIDEFVTSAMGEVANIISGNAMTGLSEQHITCDILPPEIIVGAAGCPLDQPCQIVNACVHTSIGDIGLSIKFLS